MTVREYLREATVTKEALDIFLDPGEPNWAKFDPDVGYLLKNSVMKDGLNGCYTLSHYEPGGYRRLVNHFDQPCRINTYGNSYTQCHQVSDGESWQEVLAAHLGEPIRNFGIGGHGVYQAYRRLLKQERSEHKVPFIILNIYHDDHYRSLDVWRWLRNEAFRRQVEARKETCYYFHANPWAHIELDLDSGRFEETSNPYPTPESLYQLCDEDHVYEMFGNHVVTQILAAQRGIELSNPKALKRLSEIFETPLDFSNPDRLQATIEPLYNRFSFRSTEYILERLDEFIEKENRSLLVLLSYGRKKVLPVLNGEPREDQEFVAFLKERDFRFVDAMNAHCEDFKAFRLRPDEYLGRYYIGHYNPTGNHFFAHAVRDDVVAWLEPKPAAYHDEGFSVKDLVSLLA